MQYGIKSLLGAMVLLAAFVMGVFQFSPDVCTWTLLFTHLLSPGIWVAGSYANQSRGLKTFFLCGLISGIAPWIATFYWSIVMSQQYGMRSSSQDELKERLMMLAIWSASGIIAICGGLLGYWVYRCCEPRPALAADSNLRVEQPCADPLAADELADR